MTTISKAWSVGNKPHEFVNAVDFGVTPDATYVLNGSGIPSSWSGTDNSAFLQAAIDYADSQGIRKVILPTGYCLLGGTVEVPGYMTLEGVNSYSTVLVPSNSFASGTPMVRCNDTSSDIDGLFVKNIGFQMNGLSVTNCIGLQLYKVNTLTHIDNVTFTQMGSSSIGLDIYRGSCVFLDNMRFNGGTNSTGTAFVGTNIRIRECPGVFFGRLNLEHADYGLVYENITDADGAPIYNPTLSIAQLYVESHDVNVITVEEDNAHLYTAPCINIMHIEGRASTSSGPLLEVLPYSSTNHNVVLNIGSIWGTGPFSSFVKTPTRTYGPAAFINNLFYTAGNVGSTSVDGISDALYTNPRLNNIRTAASGTSSTITLQTSAGALGTISVDNTTGRLIIDGTNGTRFTDAAIDMTALPTYADNAAATAGGLGAGRLYQTSAGDLRIRV